MTGRGQKLLVSYKLDFCRIIENKHNSTGKGRDGSTVTQEIEWARLGGIPSNNVPSNFFADCAVQKYMGA